VIGHALLTFVLTQSSRSLFFTILVHKCLPTKRSQEYKKEKKIWKQIKYKQNMKRNLWNFFLFGDSYFTALSPIGYLDPGRVLGH